MNLAIIWHMHQPDYRDAKGVMQMPWVFLHSIKDYFDMPWMMSRHKNIKATFNITSPLIEQIKLYYDKPLANDYFLNLWHKDASELQEAQQEWIIKLCKSAQFDTMVSPLPYFKTLFEKESLNNREFFDLEVLFILSWCGVYLRQNSKIVSSLIAKQKDYDLNDKIILLEELKGFIRGIFDFYKTLHAEGLISISTTPLNHPILPLLLDMDNARIANQDTNIPLAHMPLARDASLQISFAIELFYKTFGFTPEGFWPAEGAVDPKSLKLLKKYGIKWIATDEAILFKSLQNSDKKNLYHPYNYDDICIGFRDHELSDLIGFTYRFWDDFRASENFIESLKNIDDNVQNATVFVILDGENAWEFYKNNAFDFFDSLYNKLCKTTWCKTVTMDEVYKIGQKKLSNLAPGSWINGEFNTWVGDPQKTKAWDLIFQTKKEFEKNENLLMPEIKKKIEKHFLASECSDWFWWYGDDHYTDFGVEFDILFRNHLINIYSLMQISPPGNLFKPIIKKRESKDFHILPRSKITPIINGKHDSFFEWLGSGVIDETKILSTMDKTRAPIEKIFYGQDSDFLYFAFSADINSILKCDSLNIIIETLNTKIKIPINLEHKKIEDGFKIEYAFNKWLEISIDKKSLNKKRLTFRFELIKQKRIIQSLPGFGELALELDANYTQNWFI
ncbi:MAG: glycoside hydrolase family 57 protein [Sulfurospirillum sp.]